MSGRATVDGGIGGSGNAASGSGEGLLSWHGWWKGQVGFFGDVQLKFAISGAGSRWN